MCTRFQQVPSFSRTIRVMITQIWEMEPKTVVDSMSLLI